MIVKKSRKYGSKFWACTSWPECESTSPYHGNGARAGIDIDIREIKNGFVITTSDKYVDSADEDEPAEFYCQDKTKLRLSLGNVFDNAVNQLMDKIESSENFDEEPNKKESEARAKRVTRGDTDINALIAKMKETKNRISNED